MKKAVELENLTGLSEEAALRKLKQEGYNELPSQKRQSLLTIVFNVLKEPMFLLLLGAGSIYLLLGEPKDALILLFFVLVVISITVYQERKSERALEALKSLASPRALVLREGKQKRIPGREVVREDIFILKEGDRVPADGALLTTSNLMIDESLLTGESLAVRKRSGDGKTLPAQPGGDDLPFVYSGTLVVRGSGIARATATGTYTEMGRIGKALEVIDQEETLLRKETSLIVRNFAIGGLIFCALIVLIYGLLRGGWLNGFLVGLSLSMAILPEELPVVLMIFLSLGAWRLSQKQVLTRRMPAVETLGSATVLCVDKTGTLTMNGLILTSLYVGGKYHEMESDTSRPLPEKYHELLEFSNLASQKDPFDPLEKEIKTSTERFLSKTEHLHRNWKLVREYPLSERLMALSNVWESGNGTKHVIAAKGAPEAIAELCHLSPQEKEEILAQVQKMADRGLRLLGVAKGNFPEKELPEEQHDFSFEFIGLLGFIDPVRPSVPQALEECYTAGIRMIMITGDYPGTARNIARQIGLKNPDNCITGPELAKMEPGELAERIKNINIFARVVPQQKLAIVNALKANGEIVAMTGDGVNDAPALKSAHIGIAMGERGTDVARESSAIVLLNDDFSSIVSAVRLGRRIFDNLKKAITYTFSVHIPIAGLALFPVLFNLPLLLLPVHIAFLELIIDPACSTVFEAEKEEKNVMRRPPRELSERLFSRKNVLFSLLQGGSVLLALLLVFLTALYLGKGETEARTLTFTALVMANLGLIVANLSWQGNPFRVKDGMNRALWFVMGGAVLSLLLVLYIPALRALFHFSALDPGEVLVAVVVGVMSAAWLKLLTAGAAKATARTP